jgi:RND family efflux transporter MFP subunit
MRRGYWWPILVVALLVLVGCSRKPAEVAPAKPAEVQISEPVEMEIVDFEEFTGRVEAEEYVDVRTRASGYLTEVNFKEGAMVRGDRWFRPGEILAVIDPQPCQADLDGKLADLNRAVKNRDLARSQLNYAKVDYESAVQAGKAVTDVDRAAKKAAVDQSEATVDAAEANIGVAQSAVATSRLNLYYTNIRAPISGRIGQKNIRRGNLLKADDNSASAVLATIVSLDPVYVSFDMDERTYQRLDQQAAARRHDFAYAMFQGRYEVIQGLDDPALLKRCVWDRSIEEQRHLTTEQLRSLAVERLFGDWKTNTHVHAGLSGEDAFPHQGRLDFVDNRANQQSGTVRGRGTFANPNGSMVPGMYARVQVPIGVPRRALLVSESALGTDQGRRFLFIVDDDNKIVYRPVEVGQQVGGLRVIESGLKEKERVVVVGLQRIRAGVKVDPKPTEMPNASTARPPLMNNQ